MSTAEYLHPEASLLRRKAQDIPKGPPVLLHCMVLWIVEANDPAGTFRWGSGGDGKAGKMRRCDNRF
jgi:hypothetical protein